MLAVAEEIGLSPDAVMHGVTATHIKNELTEATQAAITAGAVGVPTVLVSGQSFWGDDQLTTAAAAIRAALS